MRTVEGEPGQHSSGGRPCLVLCAAPWALPSRPGPRLVEELNGVWAGRIGTLVLDPPNPEQRSDLDITAYPTWIVLAHELGTGEGVPEELGRRVGAMAKHAVREWVEDVTATLRPPAAE